MSTIKPIPSQVSDRRAFLQRGAFGAAAVAVASVAGGVRPASASLLPAATFDVRDFGAVLNGIVDDTLALQAAIDAASLADGGVVTSSKAGAMRLTRQPSQQFTPAGYGFVNTPCVRLKRGVRLVGRAGWVLSPDLYAGTSETSTIGIASGVDNWSIENVEFNGGQTAASFGEAGDHAIVSSGCADYFITGCEFYGYRGKAVQTLGEIAAPNRSSRRWRFANNFVHHIGGNACSYSGPNSDFDVTANVVEDNTNDQIGAEAFLGSSGAGLRGRIRDNRIRNFGNISCPTGADDLVVAGNTIVTSARTASPAIVVMGLCKRVLIVDNTIDNTFAPDAVGIRCETGVMSAVVVARNNITRHGGGAGASGIYVAATISGLSVRDNVITGGADSPEFALRLLASSDVDCSGNLVRGGTHGIHITSSCARVSANDNTVIDGDAIYEMAGGTVSGGQYRGKSGRNAPALRVQGVGRLLVVGAYVAGKTNGGGIPALQLSGSNHRITGCVIENAVSGQVWAARADTLSTGYLLSDIDFVGSAGTMGALGATSAVRRSRGYVTENRGSAALADGRTVAHGMSRAPTSVTLTASKTGRQLAVTSIGLTTFTVALKGSTGTSVTVAETVYWQAGV